MKNKDLEKKVLEKLDLIVELLQNLFILEASKANMKKQEIRKVLGIRMSNVSRISKFLDSPKKKK
ncbi:MAG: hypothetical protein ACKKMP_03610 [Candidatus Nealsonbacteria bacterium]